MENQETDRLLVYLLVDCGAANGATSLDSLDEFLEQSIRSGLAVTADKEIWLSVIAFSDKAEQVVLPTPLAKFTLPLLKIHGAQNLDSAMRLLARVIDEDMERISAISSPTVFLISGESVFSLIE